MAPGKEREPTRHQLSSRLAYSQHTPAFLLKLQNQFSGIPNEDEDEDEYDGSGRPPIPRRPAIPERPDDEPGSADEDDLDEKPQVVVLREGKHLTEREAENERRKVKGLPPLPEPTESSQPPDENPGKSSSSTKPKPKSEGLSFSSAKSTSKSTAKRKAVGDAGGDPRTEGKANKTAKKAKKAGKALLSFGDDV